jgi:hypothetical protein
MPLKIYKRSCEEIVNGSGENGEWSPKEHKKTPGGFLAISARGLSTKSYSQETTSF